MPWARLEAVLHGDTGITIRTPGGGSPPWGNPTAEHLLGSWPDEAKGPPSAGLILGPTVTGERRPHPPHRITERPGAPLVWRALLRAEPELLRSRLRGARAAHTTVGVRRRRSCRADATAALVILILCSKKKKREIICCAQVRRALLRAEPELPRSRLRGARAAHTTVGVGRRRSCRADATAALVTRFGY
ncbi:hypothetical protein NDU88_002573 [Pleurodeles waltl]|uniref:Uncharacterized protein n=1 Tax=Pleurodeles waltl TaxID=8319 RepID=A0AAV7SF11_PLEWA|nr:hypothetical protein NDU88_002573 [Pleurodeles waltl]